ncbi:MAG: hypothetical protein L6R42_008985 [Xanthoria sp. 1 TBL-2021]|nr:MAG: hypothetical protein L6R42_008985 [Xanthoria sp. 1 TBL-2021]
MRPLDAAEIQQDLLMRNTILLLDTTKVALRFVIQLVLADKFPVLLPTELWLDIIEHNPATTGVSSTSTALHVPECLFIDTTVPDVIARLEGGRCWVCEGERDICPGCTRGVANEFDAFMGCGVDLACPLCMGLDFMQEDKAFLQKYYRDEPPAKEEEARKARVSARLAELGYDQKGASGDDSDGGLE